MNRFKNKGLFIVGAPKKGRKGMKEEIPADSEDIVQDTFVKVYLHSDKLQNNSGFKAWMMRILVRTAWRASKKKNREFPDEEAVSGMEDGKKTVYGMNCLVLM